MGCTASFQTDATSRARPAQWQICRRRAGHHTKRLLLVRGDLRAVGVHLLQLRLGHLGQRPADPTSFQASYQIRASVLALLTSCHDLFWGKIFLL
jgi:hypothetical protein